MDQDPSSKDENQEPRTMVLRPFKNNQAFRNLGTEVLKIDQVKNPKSRIRTRGPKYL